MQKQPCIRRMRINIQMVNARRVESRRASDQSVYFISLAEQQFCKVGTVLAGDTSDKSALGCNGSVLLVNAI